MGMPMPWVYDDGGRADAGYKGKAGDCVVRAIVIASGADYHAVYDELGDRTYAWMTTSRTRAARAARARGKSPRDGVYAEVYRPYLIDHGFVWVPTMHIGSGTTVHLAAGELPDGRLIVRCSHHLVAVINGVVHDTHDSRRDGARAVYGYWRLP